MGNAYEWTTQAPYKVDADVAAAEFERIREKHGELTAKNIVDESRAEDAVLHDEFEWNDSIAAEKWRQAEAKTMARCLKIIHKDCPPTRAYVTIDYTTKRKGTYEPIDVVISDEQKSQKLFEKSLGELQAFRKKYAVLSQLSELFKVVDWFLEG